MSKTVVISIDALLSCEIDILRALPRIGELVRNASYVDDICCVYPTLTYPCHATIATGCYPDRHGITHNEKLSPNTKRSPWYWYETDIRVPTVVEIAKAHGLSTAAVTWPVMGGCIADYCIAEIWAPEETMDADPIFEKANSAAARPIYERHKHKLNWMRTPAFDNFATDCACDIIGEFSPDLMLLHLSYLDHQRHRLGVHAPELSAAYQFIDEKVGRVIDTLKAKGVFEDTNIVLLGDHGHRACSVKFNPNAVLEQMGRLTVQDGQITGYDAVISSCALSAQVFIRPGVAPELIYRDLLAMQKQYPQYIANVLTKGELKERYHLDGEFSFMLEGADGVTFGKEANLGIVEEIANSDYKYSVSTHGHMPEKGDKPPFILTGPDVIGNQVIHGGDLVQEAPTILRLLGINYRRMDGEPFPLVKGY